MDFLKNLFSCLRVALPSRPLALASSPFGKLPPELVVYITQYLPAPSVAAFYFCCRPIYAILGSQCLEELQKEESACYRFLALLERDLPNSVACYYCKKLHGIDAVRRRLSYNPYESPTCSKINVFSNYFLYYGFDYTVFALMMKFHRQGRDTTKFLNRWCHNTQTVWQSGYTYQTTVWPRIISGSLLVRKQVIIVSPAQEVPNSKQPGVIICPHYGYMSPSSHCRMGRILRIRIAHWDKPPTAENWGGVLRCPFCLTQFRIDFKEYEGHRIAMFFTRWQDLGEGRTPLDWKWLSHVHHTPITWPRVDYEGRSICDVFEGSEGFVFDSILTRENKRELRKELFREGVTDA